MPNPEAPLRPRVNQREWIIHSGRTAIAATVSLLIGLLFKLPEAYWAVITTIIVMQSTIGAALTISRHRLAGTAIGAALGALAATYAGSNPVVFGLGVFVCGLLCAAFGMERNAYRYAGITLAIVMLAARAQSPWIIAVHRFLEISLGIIVGLILTAVWPEARPNPA